MNGEVENLIYEIQFLRRLLFKKYKIKKKVDDYEKNSKKITAFFTITSIIAYVSAFIAYIDVKYNKFIVEAQGNYIIKNYFYDSWATEYFIINFIVVWTILLILPFIIIKLNKDAIKKLKSRKISVDNKLEYYVKNDGVIPEKYLKAKPLKQFKIYMEKGEAKNIDECIRIYNSRYTCK